MRPSIGWKAGFLKDFLRGDVAAMPPFTLAVDVTGRCNLHCLHCRTHSPQAEREKGRAVSDFPLDRFLGLCREAASLGIRKIVLIGEGEPLLHPGIIKMVEAAKAAGCYTVLLTNGTLLSRSARELIRAGLDELRVSLWVTDADEYRSLYPGSSPNHFYRTLEGLRSAVEQKNALRSSLPCIVLHRPIEPRLLPTLGRTVELAREAGCDAVSFSLLKPLIPEDEERVLNEEEGRQLAQALPRLGREVRTAGMSGNTHEVLRRLKIGRAVWEKLACYIGWIDMRIRVNGDVVPCDTCPWVLGNVHNHELHEIWNDAPYQEFRRVARRRDGILSSGHNCRCDYCCHAITNARLHRWLKWCFPTAGLLRWNSI